MILIIPPVHDRAATTQSFIHDWANLKDERLGYGYKPHRELLPLLPTSYCISFHLPLLSLPPSHRVASTTKLVQLTEKLVSSHHQPS